MAKTRSILFECSDINFLIINKRLAKEAIACLTQLEYGKEWIWRSNKVLYRIVLSFLSALAVLLQQYGVYYLNLRAKILALH